MIQRSFKIEDEMNKIIFWSSVKVMMTSNSTIWKKARLEKKANMESSEIIQRKKYDPGNELTIH